MNKVQFLLSFITLIPLFGAFAVYLVKKNHSFISIFTMLLALIMLGNIVNLCYNYDGDLNAISLIKIHRNVDIGLSITNISLIIALIVTLIWLVITIYSNEYFVFSEDKRFFVFKLSSILLVEFIILITFSKNLVSLFLFYQCLIFCLYFFVTHFTKGKGYKVPYGFAFSLLASSFFMFLAIAIVYKTTGTTEFVNEGILQNISYKRYFAILILFILAIASVALLPLQLLFQRLYSLNAPIIIMVFIISYGLVNLLILLKVILNIFEFDYFIRNTHSFNFSYILNSIIAVNLLLSGFLALTQNNLKRILIFLFFNQLIFAFFLFLILNQSIDQFVVVITSFILSQTLIFLCFGNINIYLLKSKERTMKGLFHKLRNTSILFSFALFSLVGLVPSIGLMEKYLLVKNYLIDDFNFNFLIILANLLLVLLTIMKIILPMLGPDKNHNVHDVKLARKLDWNLFLIFPSVVIASLMLLSFVFFGSITSSLKIFLF